MKVILTAAVFVVVALAGEPARTGPTPTSDQSHAVSPHPAAASPVPRGPRADAAARRALPRTDGAARFNDAGAPTITCPADVTLECHQPQSPSHAGTAAATGPGPIRIDFEDKTRSGQCASERVIERLWTATGIDGQTSTCVQRIWVVDSTPPEISATADATSGPHRAVASDNCDSSPTFGFIDNTTSGSSPGASVTARIWTAVDACGNVNVQTKPLTARGLADAARATSEPDNPCPAESKESSGRLVGGEPAN